MYVRQRKEFLKEVDELIKKYTETQKSLFIDDLKVSYSVEVGVPVVTTTTTGADNKNGGVAYVNIKFQDDWELVPNKFDVNTLKTFDKVLVRLTNNCVWMPKLFSHYDSTLKSYPFVTIDSLGYPQCIPYNGNEHLCRTTNNCDGKEKKFYKNSDFRRNYSGSITFE